MSKRTIAITRVFDAPRAQVFAAWTSAAHLARWFAPRGFTVPVCEAEPRPGGPFVACLRSPQGVEFWARGEYREVREPERLVIACTAENGLGGRLEELIELSFTEHAGRTTLTLNVTASGPEREAADMLDGMQETWARTVARLDSHLKPDR